VEFQSELFDLCALIVVIINMIDEVSLQRMIRLSEEAEQHEAELLLLVAKMKLYRIANDQDALTQQQLDFWVSMNISKSIDPYEVLTKEEIAQAWEDFEQP